MAQRSHPIGKLPFWRFRRADGALIRLKGNPAYAARILADNVMTGVSLGRRRTATLAELAQAGIAVEPDPTCKGVWRLAKPSHGLRFIDVEHDHV